jgi:hypothetical protein
MKSSLDKENYHDFPDFSIFEFCFFPKPRSAIFARPGKRSGKPEMSAVDQLLADPKDSFRPTRDLSKRFLTSDNHSSNKRDQVLF